MGVMMWMMMRKDQSHASPPVSDPRVAELESQVNELRMALHDRQDGGGVAATAPGASADKDYAQPLSAIGRRRPSRTFQSTGSTVSFLDIAVSDSGIVLIAFLAWVVFGTKK